METDEKQYLDIIDEAWTELQNDIANLKFGHITESDIQCELYCRITTKLKKRKLDQYFGLMHSEVKLLGHKVDLVLLDPMGSEKVYAGIEIKQITSPDLVKEDLEKLKNLVSKNMIKVGVFLSLSNKTYGLRKKLSEQRIFEKLGLEDDKQTPEGKVNWSQIKRDERVKKAGVPQYLESLQVIVGKL